MRFKRIIYFKILSAICQVISVLGEYVFADKAY